MRIVTLDQRSSEWLLWRRTGIGSSEAAAVVGMSKWDTALTIWERKVSASAKEKADSGAMARGRRLESVALECYMSLMGSHVEPICCVHDEFDWLKASLDGWDAERRIVVEIKAPNADDHRTALSRRVPDHYVTQINHQLLTSGGRMAHYVSYSDYFPPHQRLAVVPVWPDHEVLDALLAALKEFWWHVEHKVPPVMESDSCAETVLHFDKPVSKARRRRKTTV